jgi:hypothetical protein
MVLCKENAIGLFEKFIIENELYFINKGDNNK